MDKEKWIKEVDSIEVPKEAVFQAISQGIKQAEKPRRKKRMIIGALTAAAATLIIGSGFVSPTANQVLAKTPILGELYKKFDDKLGMKLAEEDMVTNLNETITKNGVTLKVTSAYFDGFQVTIVGEVYKKGKWPANEPDEISFDMNFENYKGDADPWINMKSESFNQMLTLHLFNTETKVKDAVKQKTKELDNRKKTDPTCNYQVTESPDGKEFMVDFLLGESKGDKMTIIEFNIYHYKQVDLGDKKKGILVYAYTKRAYGDDITPFLKNLRSDRIELLNAMIGSEMPTVRLSEK